MSFLNKWFSKAPSQRNFAEMMIRELAKAGVTNVRYEESDFSLRSTDKETIFLSNIYASYCGAGRQVRPAILAHSAKSFTTKTDFPKDFAAARSNLMPQVRDTSYASLVDLQFRAKNLNNARGSAPAIAVAERLEADIAFDTECSIMHLPLDTFRGWGVTIEEVFQVAKDNLRDRTDPNGMKEIAPGLHEGQWKDSYESSRILLTDLVYRLTVSGEPVAIIPNRNEFCVTGSHNHVGLKALLKTSEATHFGAHPLSPNLYLLRDGSWELYVPEDRALRELWLGIKHRRESLDYKTQKDALQVLYQNEKIDVFISEYLWIRRKNGAELSACVWSNGVDSVLPEAEFIYFMKDSNAAGRISVAWDLARPIVGALMEEVSGLIPPRYRVRSFPDSHQLAELDGVKEVKTAD